MNPRARYHLLLLIVTALCAAGCGGSNPDSASRSAGPGDAREVKGGGSLAGSIRAEPRGFNRYASVGSGQTEEIVAFLTQAKLVRVNRISDEVEPWLAESWTEVSRQSAVGSGQSEASSISARGARHSLLRWGPTPSAPGSGLPLAAAPRLDGGDPPTSLFELRRAADQPPPGLRRSAEALAKAEALREGGCTPPSGFACGDPKAPRRSPLLQTSSSQQPQALPEARSLKPEAGPIYRIKLRQGVTFSDGMPFTSADVLFALEAIYDPRVSSPLADTLRVNGLPLKARALGDHEVEIAFPAPYGPGVRMLDALWVLPRHKLEAARRAGTLAQTWGPTTPPADIAGLGPFVLREYRPGERMVFDRNPRYWRRDEQGRQLPYLDRLTLEILPDQTAELLRLQSGQLDFTHSAVRSEDYLSLKRAHDEGRVRLLDLGVSLDSDWFWFNLSPQPSAVSRRPDWLRAVEFRQAISLAVNRKAYCETVFLGAAEPVHGPVTPGNPSWYWPELPGGEYDPARAQTLLAGLGLTDRNGDGMLEDAQGRAVRFTVVLQRGISAVERGASFIRDELAKVGVGLDVVGLDAGAIFQRWGSGDYDVIFHRLLFSDSDPARNLDFWLSSGGQHVWNAGQKKPATDWEQQIDDLMRRQAASPDRSERVRLFREAQRIFSEHVPIINFAAQRLFLATSARLTHATPSRLIPLILWNADTLAVAPQR